MSTMSLLKIALVSAVLIFVGNQIYKELYAIPPLPQIDENAYWGPGKSKPDNEAIRPFKIKVSDAILKDLKVRLELELRQQPSLEETNFDYGFHSEELKKVIQFWKSPEYNWTEREAKLNSFPQFITQISGLDIHFLHVKPKNVPKGVKILPLLLLHGWPGSVKEFYGLIPLLTTYSKENDFVFEVICPSLPGYTFSEASHKQGLSTSTIAIIMKKLMVRLEHEKFYVQGGDWGGIIVADLATIYPENVLGMHSNMCAVSSSLATMYLYLASLWPGQFMDQDMADTILPLSDMFSNIMLESGYLHIQATKPDTVGVALTNSPVGLAAYILEKFSTWTNPSYRNLRDGGLTLKFTLPDLLDNVMMYWVTGSISSSMRLYSETFNSRNWAEQWDRIPSKVPSVCAQFPYELMMTPAFILRLKFPNLLPAVYPTPEHPLYPVVRPPRGGHFAAFEEPHLMANSIFRGVQLIREAAAASAPQA